MVFHGPADHVTVSREVLDALFGQAHTINTFSAEPVDPAVIAAVYEDIRWAPRR